MDKQIAKFWSWWSTARLRLELAIIGNHWAGLSEDIEQRVRAIHPALSWEVTKGHFAEHALCLCSNQDPFARLDAERWLKAGPEPDSTWEYHAARLPWLHEDDAFSEPNGAIEGLTVVTNTNEPRALLDVRAYHPSFAAMDTTAREAFARSTIEAVLGEDGAARWIGSVKTSVEPLAAGSDIATIEVAVAELESQVGSKRFSRVELTEEAGLRAVGTVNTTLKRLDHLLCTTYGRVRISTGVPEHSGVFHVGQTAEIAEIEKELLDEIAASIAYVGTTWSSLWRSTHFYTATPELTVDAIGRWRRRYGHLDVEMMFVHDPMWKRYETIVIGGLKASRAPSQCRPHGADARLRRSR